jgi:hypothetical protein
LDVQLFAQRVFGGQLGELRDEFRVPPGVEVGVDAVADRREPGFFQAAAELVADVAGGRVGEGGAAPQLEGGGEPGGPLLSSL